MKQILQDLKTGSVELAEIPCSTVGRGHLLIQTSTSLISAGTEKMLLEFGKANLLQKARQQPDKVRQVFQKIRTDGLLPTVQAVMAKLDQPVPLGYCNVGRVLAVGEDVRGFAVGDRVVSNGNHAEIVMVPKNLAARIPDNVGDEEAAFTVLGSIALEGIRLVQPTLGETIGVFGLGLIGLLAVQILKAHGARVIGFDYDGSRVELARHYGAAAESLAAGVDPVAAAQAFTAGCGVDGVLITAATKSDELMHQAAQMCRQRGRIVLTGVTGLNLQRSDFYEKELTFQVSCSYGPGRYDPSYEEQGHDYPRGFVRWTEQRNFEAILELLADRRLSVEALVSKRVAFHEAHQAYEAVLDKSVIGVILTYPQPVDEVASQALTVRVVHHHGPRDPQAAVVLGLIGAGGFAQQKLLPGLVSSGARLKWVATSKGLSGAQAARKFHIEQSTTETRRLLDDPEVNAVVIATRHNTHASLVVEALKAGKSVFVEKPLCLTEEELTAIQAAYEAACHGGRNRPIVMVGFNRRFAPLVTRLRSHLAGRTQPPAMTVTCNAGAIPAGHWTQDPAIGGGRILGEVCHFIDLLHFLADESPVVQVAGLRQGPDDPGNLSDTVALSLRFADGSLGQINYFANGARSFPKERFEVFSEGRILRLDNFRRLEVFGARGGRRSWSQDKGHNDELRAFVEAVRGGGESPIGFDSLVETARATLAAWKAVVTGQVITLDGQMRAMETKAGKSHVARNVA
jgi:predicted dehydrogenase/threonine dehydrogenase-like Zn-dependent dehydrogenase